MPDGLAPKNSAGPGAIRGGLDAARRCRLSAGAWRPVPGWRRGSTAPRRSSCATTGRRAWRPHPRTSAPAPTPCWRRWWPNCWGSRASGSRWCWAIRSLPPGPLSGGSMLTASLRGADHELRSRRRASELIAAWPAVPRSAAATPSDLAFSRGLRHVEGRRYRRRWPFDEVLQAREDRRRSPVRAPARARSGSQEKPKLSSHSFGAHFVEVTWRPEIARLRVSRVVSVIDAGRIINPLLARNQIEGSVVMGIGMALFEEHRIRPAQRRADECQPRGLRGRNQRRRAGARSPLHRVSRPEPQRASAPAAWARSASRAPPRRSPMRYIMRPECGFASFL